MYEPRVRNRHVAPEKMDILSNDGHFSFFLLINKERLKIKGDEKEKNDWN